MWHIHGKTWGKILKLCLNIHIKIFQKWIGRNINKTLLLFTVSLCWKPLTYDTKFAGWKFHFREWTLKENSPSRQKSHFNHELDVLQIKKGKGDWFESPLPSPERYRPLKPVYFKRRSKKPAIEALPVATNS